MLRQSSRSIPQVASSSKTAAQQSRAYARASFVGRLKDTPEKKVNPNGSVYYKYAVAVRSSLSNDANTKKKRDVDGRIIRPVDWFTIVSFSQIHSHQKFLSSLRPGTLVAIDARITSRATTNEDGGERSYHVFRETDVQVVDDPTPRARPEEFDSRSSYGKSNQRETEYEEEDVGSGQERRRR